jgi:RNA polymerase sigma-70 factor (ECF subfamily)
MPSQDDEELFKSDLLALIPHMRAFARSLCGDFHEAEDLAQEALAKAWAGRATYVPGTNLKAWTFMIVRNQFFSERRRSWRSCQLDPEVAERTLVANTNQSATLELDEVRRALDMLPDDQREALILIAAAGLSYDEVSEICGVAIGTIKSRVSRGRDRLALIYADGEITADRGEPSQAMAMLMAQAERLSLPHCA